MRTAAHLLVFLAVACAAVSAPAAPAAPLVDNFDGAVDLDPGYGLNDSLPARQGRAPAVTYTRVSGLWYPASAPRPWFSQVNHPGRGGELSFWLGTSAVRVDAPLVRGADGRIAVRAVADPANGDTGSDEWVSLVLSSRADASGYVSDGDVAVGLLVRSSGRLQVFQGGKLQADLAPLAGPDAAGRYPVGLSFRPGERVVSVTVGGAEARVSLDSPLPSGGTLFLGAYLRDSNRTSTIDDLNVGSVDRSALSLGSTAGLRYFGYYAARLAPAGTVTGGGDHLPEIAGRSNLNFVNISDRERYAPEVLDHCAPRSCIVYTGNELFTGCDQEGSPSCTLYPNYAERWGRLADVVAPHLDRIAAFYLLDEPFLRGAKAEDLATSALAIHQRFPGIPVMMVEAGPKVTPELVVPAGVDWIGFDWYCQPMESIAHTLDTLESRVPADSGQRLFLLPEAAPLSACGGAPGHASDADIASLQWEYLRLAERHPRVIGLLAFGPWVSGHDPSAIPQTIDAHERIAARILPAEGADASSAPAADSARTRGARMLGRTVRVDARGTAHVRMACPDRSTCRGTVALLAASGKHRARYAGARFRIASGRRHRVRIRLRAVARRRIARVRRLGATIVIKTRGAPRTVARVTLRSSTAHRRSRRPRSSRPG